MTTRRRKRHRVSPQSIMRPTVTACSGATDASDDDDAMSSWNEATPNKHAISTARSGSAGKSSSQDGASLPSRRAAASSSNIASSSNSFSAAISDSRSNITGDRVRSADADDCRFGGERGQASNTFQLIMEANESNGKCIAESSIVRLPWTQFPSIMDLFQALRVQHSILRKYRPTGAKIRGRDGDGEISGSAALGLKMDTSRMCGGLRELRFTVEKDRKFRERSSRRKRKRPPLFGGGIENSEKKMDGEWVVRDVLEHRNLGSGWQFFTKWQDWDSTWVDGSAFYNADGVVTEALADYLAGNEAFANSRRYIRWRDVEIKKLKAIEEEARK